MSIQTFTAYVAGLTNATAVVGADEPVINQSGTVKAVTNTVHRAYLDSYYGVQGRKIDLNIKYVSSDVLSVGVGACEVNDGTDSWWVEKTSATTINSGTTNYPSAGAWAFVALKADGTVSLYAATGTAAQRPTNNLFQLTGGSVGYDDIGKGGYYYDADERVIGAFHKVSATSFYIINLGDGCTESGQNSLGYWERSLAGRTMKQYGAGSQTTDTAASPYYYDATAVSFPIAFSAIRNCILQTNFAGTERWANAYAYNTTQFTGLVWGVNNSEAITYSWTAEGGF